MESHQEFLDANKEVICALKSLVQAEECSADLLEKFQGIDEFYNKQGDVFYYAEIQLGLAKWLDFNLDFKRKEMLVLQNKVFKVVTTAYQFLQVTQNNCLQNHEDGACLIGGLNYAKVSKDLSLEDWPELPMAHAVNFSGKIDPIDLLRGTTIYRIVSARNGLSYGHWWLENCPVSKKLWRSGSAVSEQWNTGDYCIEATLTQDLHVWCGIAATQAVPKSISRCYLKGGVPQLWLDPDKLDKASCTDSPLNTW